MRHSLWAFEIPAEYGFTMIRAFIRSNTTAMEFRGSAGMQTLSTPSGLIVKVPIATVRFSDRIIAPVGGGAYLRLLPYRYTAAGIRWINHHDQQPACMYFHPWELDPGQPRVASGRLSRLRTYGGLRSMAGKLERLPSNFEFTR